MKEISLNMVNKRRKRSRRRKKNKIKWKWKQWFMQFTYIQSVGWLIEIIWKFKSKFSKRKRNWKYGEYILICIYNLYMSNGDNQIMNIKSNKTKANTRNLLWLSKWSLLRYNFVILSTLYITATILQLLFIYLKLKQTDMTGLRDSTAHLKIAYVICMEQWCTLIDGKFSLFFCIF